MSVTRRYTLVIAVAILFLVKPSLADDKPSPAVKRILDEASAEVKKNRQAFDKANEKPIAEAREQLQELAKKLVDEGKPEEATGVLKQISTLEKEVLGKADTPPSGTGKNKPAPQKALLERMAGKWRRAADNFVFVIGPDGVVQISNGDQGKLVVASPEAAEVALKSGYRLRLLMAHEDVVCSLEWEPRGRQTPGFVLERIK